MAGRTPTICEWALGITVEEFADRKARRQRRKDGKSQQRFSVEVSTDNESEEDSLKITYPRSKAHKESPKKVRFERDHLRSALKTRDSDISYSGSETKTSSGSTSRSSSKSSSGTSTSSSHSSSSRRKKHRSHDLDSADTTESSGDSSSSYSDCDCRRCRQERRRLRKRVGHGKKHRTEIVEIDSSGSSSSSSDGESRRKSRKSKSKKESKSQGDDASNKQLKNKKSRVIILENDESADEASEQEPSTKQGKKKNKGSPPADVGPSTSDKTKAQGKGKKSKQQEEKVPDPELIKDNNVVPTEKDQAVPENTSPKNNEKGGSGGKNKKQKEQKQGNMRPEADVAAHMRRPNLIMPVRAQVLQVEHAIEGIEDPRPNAFHDGEHGVVRVYHGPTYGNPYGILYPPRTGSYPPHAPPQAGTPHPAMNPYLNGFANPCNPGDVQNQGESPWSGVPITSMPEGPPLMATAGPPNMARNPVMSGGMGSDKGFGKPRTRDNGWPSSQGTSPGYPINVNMYSYAGHSDPRSDDGRRKYSSPDKRRVTFDPMNANANNDGPRLYGADGSHNGSNTSSSRRKATHPDLSWSPKPDQPKPSTNDWVNSTSGNNDAWGGTADNVGGTNNDANSAPDWAATNNDPSNDWQPVVIDSRHSNSSKGSKKSNRSNTGANTDNNFGDNAPPIGSGGSNHSGGSKGNGNGGVDNNVGPVGDDPWGSSNPWPNQTGDVVANNDPSKNMPGAWDGPTSNSNGNDNGNGNPSWQGDDGGGQNASFVQTTPADNGGFPWGDTSAAQNVGGDSSNNTKDSNITW